MSLITYGLGMFVGSWVSGAVVGIMARSRRMAPSFTIGVQSGYGPALCPAVVLLGFLFTFSDKEGTSEPIVRPAAGEELPGALI